MEAKVKIKPGHVRTMYTQPIYTIRLSFRESRTWFGWRQPYLPRAWGLFWSFQNVCYFFFHQPVWICVAKGCTRWLMYWIHVSVLLIDMHGEDKEYFLSKMHNLRTVWHFSIHQPDLLHKKWLLHKYFLYHIGW